MSEEESSDLPLYCPGQDQTTVNGGSSTELTSIMSDCISESDRIVTTNCRLLHYSLHKLEPTI